MGHDVKFEQSGFEKFKRYSLAEVAPWFCVGYHRDYNLPTEMVIDEPGFVVPKVGRIWNTEFDYGHNGKVIIPRVWCAEIFEDCGDDGHTSMRLEHFVFFDSEDEKELEALPREKDWKGKDRPFSLIHAVQGRVREKEDIAENARREALKAAGKNPWEREEELRPDPKDITNAGLLKRLSIVERNNREEFEELRANYWRMTEKFKRFHERVSEELLDEKDPHYRMHKFMVESYNPNEKEEE
jgi:hypothetical protein